MADIKVSCNITGSKNGRKVQATKSFSENIGDFYTDSSQDITTAAAQSLTLSASQTDIGRIWLYNSDATNFIKIIDNNGGTPAEFGELKAGEVAVFRLRTGMSASDLRFQADTATCKLYFWAADQV